MEVKKITTAIACTGRFCLSMEMQGIPIFIQIMAMRLCTGQHARLPVQLLRGRPRISLALLHASSYNFKAISMFRALLLIIFSIALLSGCKEPGKETIRMSNVSIRIGEQGQDFVKRYPNEMKTDRQPAGLDFYSIDWPASKKGIVSVENGRHGFAIENILGVVGTQNKDYPAEGIAEWNITAGITGPTGISHDDARKKMFSILQQLLKAGWKVTIPADVPRIRGKDMLDYLIQEKRFTTLDAEYTPTLEEWMAIDSSTVWELYADHIFLEASFMRESTLKDPTKPSAYLLTFKLKNEAESFRGYVEGEDRVRWKALLPAELAKLAPARLKAETEMRRKGIKIDETYQDPPVPDLR